MTLMKLASEAPGINWVKMNEGNVTMELAWAKALV